MLDVAIILVRDDAGTYSLVSGNPHHLNAVAHPLLSNGQCFLRAINLKLQWSQLRPL